MKNIEELAKLGEVKLREMMEGSLRKIELDLFALEKENNEFMLRVREKMVEMSDNYYLSLVREAGKRYDVYFEDLIGRYRKEILPKLAKYLGEKNEQ